MGKHRLIMDISPALAPNYSAAPAGLSACSYPRIQTGACPQLPTVLSTNWPRDLAESKPASYALAGLLIASGAHLAAFNCNLVFTILVTDLFTCSWLIFPDFTAASTP